MLICLYNNFLELFQRDRVEGDTTIVRRTKIGFDRSIFQYIPLHISRYQLMMWATYQSANNNEVTAIPTLRRKIVVVLVEKISLRVHDPFDDTRGFKK